MFCPYFRNNPLKNLKAYILHHFIKRNQQGNKVAYKIIKHISNKHVQTGSKAVLGITILFCPYFRNNPLKNLKAYILHHFIKRNQQGNKVAYKIIKHISNKHVQTGSNRIKMDQNGSN